MAEQLSSTGDNKPKDGFADLVARDGKFFGLVIHRTFVEQKYGVFEQNNRVIPRHLTEQAKQLQEQADQRQQQLQKIWHDVEGDAQAFELLVPVHDWQAIAEHEEDLVLRQHALEELYEAREQYAAYLSGETQPE